MPSLDKRLQAMDLDPTEHDEELIASRRKEIEGALSTYAGTFGVDAFMSSYGTLLQDEAMFAQTKVLLDTLLAYSASAESDTIELGTSKSGKQRALMHGLVRLVQLYSKSQSLDGVEVKPSGNRWQPEVELTVVVGKRPFPRPELPDTFEKSDEYRQILLDYKASASTEPFDLLTTVDGRLRLQCHRLVDSIGGLKSSSRVDKACDQKAWKDLKTIVVTKL